MQTKGAIEDTSYAIPKDFCRIFAEDMDALYWFSLLLTADREKAEQCFVSGLDGCLEENRVFKEWARSWARRAIAQNAIRMVRPTPEQPMLNVYAIPSNDGRAVGLGNVSLAAVFRLKPFERFVFVMSVLEHYSDQECKTLLGCSRQDIMLARATAMEQLAAFRGVDVPTPPVHTFGRVRHEGGFAQSA